MEGGYRGSFQPDETGYCGYRPAEADRYFYCLIYPGEENGETALTEYGKQGIRARIVPYAADRVTIAGWEGVFDILPFSSRYTLLDNGESCGKSRRKALIAAEDIRNHFLEIKER